MSELCPNYLVGSSVVVFKIHNQGQSEQALGKQGQRAQRFITSTVK